MDKTLQKRKILSSKVKAAKCGKGGPLATGAKPLPFVAEMAANPVNMVQKPSGTQNLNALTPSRISELGQRVNNLRDLQTVKPLPEIRTAGNAAAPRRIGPSVPDQNRTLPKIAGRIASGVVDTLEAPGRIAARTGTAFGKAASDEWKNLRSKKNR